MQLEYLAHVQQVVRQPSSGDVPGANAPPRRLIGKAPIRRLQFSQPGDRLLALGKETLQFGL
jgi:hypothetical protein